MVNSKVLVYHHINTLITIEHVFQSLLPQTTCQAKQCDLVEAAKEAVTVISPSYKRGQIQRCGIHYIKTLHVELATKIESATEVAVLENKDTA